MRVLVVDDSPVMRAIVSRVAEDLGFSTVGECATLDEARGLAARAMPDAIVVDGRLAADILTVVRALRGAAPAAEIFVLASLEEVPLVKLATAAGARGAIRRPIVASQMRDALNPLRDRPR